MPNNQGCSATGIWEWECSVIRGKWLTQWVPSTFSQGQRDSFVTCSCPYCSYMLLLCICLDSFGFYVGITPINSLSEFYLSFTTPIHERWLQIRLWPNYGLHKNAVNTSNCRFLVPGVSQVPSQRDSYTVYQLLFGYWVPVGQELEKLCFMGICGAWQSTTHHKFPIFTDWFVIHWFRMQ